MQVAAGPKKTVLTNAMIMSTRVTAALAAVVRRPIDRKLLGVLAIETEFRK